MEYSNEWLGCLPEDRVPVEAEIENGWEEGSPLLLKVLPQQPAQPTLVILNISLKLLLSTGSV